MRSGNRKYVLVINPGSTSTKVGIFEESYFYCQEDLEHSPGQLSSLKTWQCKLTYRKQLIERFLFGQDFACEDLAAVVGRGGLLKPLKGGTYLVNEKMLRDAEKGVQGQHAANLGCALAYQIARRSAVPAFVVDPISVDEFEPLARYSGHHLIKRRALSHALSIHGVVRLADEQLQLEGVPSNYVVAHLGGGISVAAVRDGKIIDVNDAASEGPFSPERTGSLPLQDFITICYSGTFSEDELRKFVMGHGGLVAYLGTNSAREIEERIVAGDEKAVEVYQAMAYQIAKEIGAMSAVLNGCVAAIILTGGLARSEMLTEWVMQRISFLATVLRMPGGYEMEAMNAGALRVLKGEEAARIYD